jgi:hypothetical protein
MEPTPNTMTAQESLDLITRMIRQTQQNVQQSSFYLLLWGWVVALAHIGASILILLEYPRPYMVWLITIPAWFITMYRAWKQGRTARSTSHFDHINGALWACFGICIFTLIPFGAKINFQLNAVILLLTALPTSVSGVILRFKPLVWGGVCFWLCGIASFLLPAPWQHLVGLAAITAGYLVPGYMLRNKSNNV